MKTATCRLPLFPLPNAVHFPSTDLRLHIFEPRYRRLIEDLCRRPASERLIGMVLLKPGWQVEGAENPAIYEPGTAGLLVKLHYLPDGRSNIQLRGQFRFEVRKELEAGAYRTAIVQPLLEAGPPERAPELDDLRTEVVEILRSLRQRLGGRFPSAINPGRAQVSISELVNTVAAELDIPVENKLDLLTRELPDRASRILSILRSRQTVLDMLEPYRHISGNPDAN